MLSVAIHRMSRCLLPTVRVGHRLRLIVPVAMFAAQTATRNATTMFGLVIWTLFGSLGSNNRVLNWTQVPPDPTLFNSRGRFLKFSYIFYFLGQQQHRCYSSSCILPCSRVLICTVTCRINLIILAQTTATTPCSGCRSSRESLSIKKRKFTKFNDQFWGVKIHQRN